ncbi:MULTISPECIES: type II secretion system F family protein [unclassified Mesorhizobium]|uniref:type II secretion system F family protein n=1 Tax=unclassified Mesorhizobium TaxID=325217 RepID=UPI000FD8D39C|nr:MULTISPECIES: type II secretion system F family protein [unclassified Mesorhizobium]TGR44351.1 type II secretion system F family protein [bacterium M00.F.Ca.ET.199.01.1.1]TGU33217.1 type II secretion system F family protein [bacterium M00.F.Ca.ET.156.01.1.1]TGV87422.1 type II secretion system F family protein [Mesorhizobium sp. M00.F.Ca.ET.149.01.1.1]TIT53019.1 MAG: type II secretion system F family protein [Mesorhizobium sp.]TGR27505.1 type II secretion system F family protein [Mesorhizobi
MLSNIQGLSFLVSTAVFVAAASLFLFGALVFLPALQTRKLVAQSLTSEGIVDRRSLAGQEQLLKISAQRPVDAYFRSMEKERNEPNALEAKLFRAGFYQPSAPLIYTLSRLGAVCIGFLVAYALLVRVLPPQLPAFMAFAGSALFGLACIVIPAILLDRFENAQKQIYRRGFPDFMDMMITCADAGMSLEAAVERVGAELAGTHKWLGIQLAIMNLQLRAGKPLREALRELADRIGLEEARSLAVLFRQSEELGTSLTEALRVYSDEMRGQRILTAEEKANALPVKMMIPLGLCIFPVVMMVIMLPVIIRMKGIFF